jgi:hypothetical protein
MTDQHPVVLGLAQIAPPASHVVPVQHVEALMSSPNRRSESRLAIAGLVTSGPAAHDGGPDQVETP